MRTPLLSFVAFTALTFSCTKSNTPATPPVLENAKVELTNPADSSFFALSDVITIRAKVTADASDLSFLNGYVLNWVAGVSDTLATTSITTEGDISVTLPDTLSAGIRTLYVFVRNPANPEQAAQSSPLVIYLGTPPPIQITLIEKDDISNTIHWTKSEVPNFTAYEIYAIRSDGLPDRGPQPDGELIGTITNRDSLSFRDDSIYFFYKYRYIVKVVTQEDERSKSEPKMIVSGNFMQLGEFYASRYIFFDPQQQRIFYPFNKLMVIDPQQLEYIDSIPLPDGSRWLGMNDDKSRLDMVLEKDYNLYQTVSVEVNTKQVTVNDTFSFPDGPKTILAWVDKTVLYAGNVSSNPFIPVTVAFNTDDRTQEIIRWGYTGSVQRISGDRLIVSNYSDSFFVFTYSAGNFSQIKSAPIAGISTYAPLAYESPNLIAIGNALYDQSFNKIHEIDFGTGNHTNFFTGISSDGQYAATQQNEILNTTTKQVERLYGDGFGGTVYFNSNNSVLYTVTGNGLNVRWQPGSRLHRYPWR